MRRVCNIAYAELVEGLTLEGREKIDAYLEGPLRGGRSGGGVGRSTGTRKLMAAFSLQSQGGRG